MRTMNRACVLLASLTAAYAARDGSAPTRVIQEVRQDSIVLQDGGRVLISPQTRVERRGYDFTLNDLRPGWAIETEPAPDGGERRPLAARWIRVVGIPVVQTFPAYRGLRDTVTVAGAEIGFTPQVASLAGADLPLLIQTLTAAVLQASGRFVVFDNPAAAKRNAGEGTGGDPDTTAMMTGAVAKSPGLIVPAQYLVRTSLLDFDHAMQRGNSGGAFGISGSKTKVRSKLAMDIRLIDNASGEVIASASTTRSFGSEGLNVRADISELARVLSFDMSDRTQGLAGAWGAPSRSAIPVDMDNDQGAITTAPGGDSSAIPSAQNGYPATVDGFQEDGAIGSGSFGGRGRSFIDRIRAGGAVVAHHQMVQSPLGELFALAVNDLVERLVAGIGERPWRSVIVRADRNAVVVRGGENVGIREGLLMTVLRPSESLEDPDTGEALGTTMKPIGHLKVTQVQAKFSVGRTVDGAPFRRGDVCVINKART